MSDTHTGTTRITDRIRPITAGGPVVAVHFLGDDPVFVLGEETLLFWRDGAEQRVAVHGGGILASVCDGTSIVTGGDDGKVVATNPAGESGCASMAARLCLRMSMSTPMTRPWPIASNRLA